MIDDDGPVGDLDTDGIPDHLDPLDDRVLDGILSDEIMSDGLGDPYAVDDMPTSDDDADGIPNHLDPLDDRVIAEILAPVEDLAVDPTAPDPVVTDPVVTDQHPLDPAPAPDHAPLALPAEYVGHDLEEATEAWHRQEESHSCAVACQEFILDDITGVDHPEGALSEIAAANGWYTPGYGTPPEHIGLVLEEAGIPTEQVDDASLGDLATALQNGEHVIVGVHAQSMIEPVDPSMSLDDYPGMPDQQANHAIQVIGIDNSDPDNPTVVVNDPDHPDGRGMEVPLETFDEAWKGFLMTAKAA